MTLAAIVPLYAVIESRLRKQLPGKHANWTRRWKSPCCKEPVKFSPLIQKYRCKECLRTWERPLLLR